MESPLEGETSLITVSINVDHNVVFVLQLVEVRTIRSFFTVDESIPAKSGVDRVVNELAPSVINSETVGEYVAV